MYVARRSSRMQLEIDLSRTRFTKGLTLINSMFNLGLDHISAKWIMLAHTPASKPISTVKKRLTKSVIIATSNSVPEINHKWMNKIVHARVVFLILIGNVWNVHRVYIGRVLSEHECAMSINLAKKTQQINPTTRNVDKIVLRTIRLWK